MHKRLATGYVYFMLAVLILTTPSLGWTFSMSGGSWDNYWNGYRWVTPIYGYYYPYYYSYYYTYTPFVYYTYPSYAYYAGTPAQYTQVQTNVQYRTVEKVQYTYSNSQGSSVPSGSTQTYCGDGWCSGSESQHSCPADCRPALYCGDGLCNNGETSASCPYDCESIKSTYCGDGKCKDNENPYNCPRDCGAAPYCGDGKCNGDETKLNCAKDCGLAPYCGNGKCDLDESKYNCAVDCGLPPYCGDGSCNGAETKSSCSLDCGYPKCSRPEGEEGEKICDNREILVCESGFWELDQVVECCDSGDCQAGHYCRNNRCQFKTYCGDGKCLDSENPRNCPVDCGSRITPSQCGDGICNNGETGQTCPVDCGSRITPSQCGDGVCDVQSENQQSCPADCGAPLRRSVELVVIDECFEIEQGDSGEFTLAVMNTGEGYEELFTSASGSVAQWVSQPTLVSVPRGSSETWKLVVNVPADADPGLYSIVASVRNSELQDNVTLHVDVKLRASAESPVPVTLGGNQTTQSNTGAVVGGQVPDWMVIAALAVIVLLLFALIVKKTASRRRLVTIKSKIAGPKEANLTP